MKKWNEGRPARRRETRPPFAAAGRIGGFAATVVFAVYNGTLGVWYASLWYGSICVYYILLSLLRGILLAAQRRADREKRNIAENYRKRIFTITSGIMLVMNAALAAPVSLMVLDRRPIHTGLIPAITSAAYTTYKVFASATKLKRTSGTVLDRELSVIRLIDALVSVLVLQNTLIVAVEGGIPPRLFLLIASSSAGILLLIFAVSVVWFVQGLAASA